MVRSHRTDGTDRAAFVAVSNDDITVVNRADRIRESCDFLCR